MLSLAARAPADDGVPLAPPDRFSQIQLDFITDVVKLVYRQRPRADIGQPSSDRAGGISTVTVGVITDVLSFKEPV